MVSAERPDTRSSTLVRNSSRRTSSFCRSSTSASRYSATVRSLPENSAANRSGSSCPASDSAASRSPAAHPSVRSYSVRRADSPSSTPAAASSSRVSARLNRRSAARISVSSPSSRSRCSPSRGSCRVARTTRSSSGARITSSSSWRRASSDPSSCRSSTTSQVRSASGARSFSNRSMTAHPSRSGAADKARISAAPGAVWRSASATDSQNRCGSRYASLHRHPRSPLRQACRADPRPQQNGLPAARRRRHHRHSAEAPAARTVRDGKRHLPHRDGQCGRRRSPMPRQAPWPDHRTTPAGKHGDVGGAGEPPRSGKLLQRRRAAPADRGRTRSGSQQTLSPPPAPS